LMFAPVPPVPLPAESLRDRRPPVRAPAALFPRNAAYPSNVGWVYSRVLAHHRCSPPRKRWARKVGRDLSRRRVTRTATRRDKSRPTSVRKVLHLHSLASKS
jgi:hypothetical protein